MTTFENQLYLSQANRISVLNKELQFLSNTVTELQEKYRQAEQPAAYYMALQKAIQESETLQSEWRRFIGILTLYNPNIPGLTCPEGSKK